MKSFLDSSERIFLIYGNLHDTYFSVNLRCSFLQVLDDTLKNRGYKTVYFSGSNVCNKQCFNDESAMFFINSNNQEDLFMNHSSSVEESINSTSGSIFGALDSLHDAVDNMDNDQDSEETDNSSAKKGKKDVQRKQPDCLESVFIDEVIKYMDSEEKCAVVFTNFWDFLNRTDPFQSRRYQELLSNIWSEPTTKNENIIIFLAPDSSIDPRVYISENHTISFGGNYGWGNSFFLEGNKLNEKNCIYVGAPLEDEFREMIKSIIEEVNYKSEKKVTVQPSDKKDDTVLEIATLLQRISHDRNLMLKDIYLFVRERIIHDEQHILSVDQIKKWYGIKEEEEDPLEQLNKPGWEKPYKIMKTIYNANKKSSISTISTDELNEITSHSTVARLCRIETGNNASIPHFVLTGNPGVGKTEIARLIGRILHRCGLLPIGHTHEVTKADLVSGYLGGTPQKTLSQIQAANGGVLFIDEAPSLAAKDGGSNSEQTGRDVLRELVSAMTKPEYSFCLILSGYEEPMKGVFELEPGLKSRISDQNIINIDDCSPKLLEKIFLERIAKHFENEKVYFSPEIVGEDNKHITATEMVEKLKNELKCSNSFIKPDKSQKAEETLLNHFFYNIYRSRKKSQFGNARESIKLAESVITVVEANEEETGTGKTDSHIINMEDFGDKNQRHFQKTENSTYSEIQSALNRFAGEDIRNLVKDTMDEIILRRTEAKVLNPNLPADSLPRPKNMIFCGHPGTGKTQIARLFSQLYCQLQILGSSNLLELNASELVGDVIGQASEKTREIVRRAQDEDALLFIDEAHQLCDTPTYGKNVIDALMAPMTDSKHPLTVIFAVYPERLKDFLNVNPGMKSRVKVIEFTDYNVQDLKEIFIKQEEIEGFDIDPNDDFHTQIELLLESMYDARDKNFGNGRDVVVLFEEICAERRKQIGNNEDEIRRNKGKGFEVCHIPEKYKELIEKQKKHRDALDSQQDILGSLSELCGYDGVKSVIEKKSKQVQFNKLLKQHGMEYEDIYPGHYCFVGNPGCGKSTGAEMMAKAFYQMGIISGCRFKACSAKDLVGEYVGQTAGKTFGLLEESLDGVLLIDEAYQLSPAYNFESSDYNAAALTELVAFMDNPAYRKRSCIILAGYEDRMHRVYEANPGLKSRLQEIKFPDYSDEELWEIFNSLCKGHVEISDNDKSECETLFKNAIHQLKVTEGENFANGRTVRSVFDCVMSNRRDRILKASQEDNTSPETQINFNLIKDDFNSIVI